MEKYGLMTRAFGVTKGADSFGGFILVCSEKIVEALVTNRSHKPFSTKSVEGEESGRDQKEEMVLSHTYKVLEVPQAHCSKVLYPRRGLALSPGQI